VTTDRDANLKDFSTVTEVPGNRISAEAFEMMRTRYAFAREFCQGKDVFEAACGAGQGLRCIARVARTVVGGDYTDALLRLARGHYGNEARLVRLDAHELPFRNGSFDTILLYEALYYLSRPERFLEECRRILRQPGIVIICTANKERRDFNPSPFSYRYFSGAELAAMLKKCGFRTELRAAFPVSAATIKDWMVSVLKRAAVKSRLIPKTMRGKELLKRMLFGRLVTMPQEVPEIPEHYATSPVTVPDDASLPGFKVLYAVGWLSETNH
jgi:ubiquinone/menaquinone biosynthesis C-methylase UbiE